MRSLSFSLLIVLGLVASTLAGDCSNLIFSSTGGKEHVYNLDALTNLASIGAAVTINGFVYNFDIAVCRPLAENCPNTQEPSQSVCYVGPATPGGAPRKNNAAVCQHYQMQNHSQTIPATFCFGQYNTAGNAAFTVSEVKTGNGGVLIQYTGGDVDPNTPNDAPFTSSVTVMCSPTTTGTPLVDGAAWGLTAPHASFVVHHAAGCPLPPKKKGLSGGSICLIILSVAIVVYIVGGCLYNKFVKARTGTSMFPNHTFWSNLPGLLADGFRFLICRPAVGAQPEYERVGE